MRRLLCALVLVAILACQSGCKKWQFAAADILSDGDADAIYVVDD